MLKIFLCDDDPFFLSLESDLITRCIRRNRLPARSEEHTSELQSQR